MPLADCRPQVASLGALSFRALLTSRAGGAADAWLLLGFASHSPSPLHSVSWCSLPLGSQIISVPVNSSLSWHLNKLRESGKEAYNVSYAWKMVRGACGARQGWVHGQSGSQCRVVGEDHLPQRLPPFLLCCL